ASGGAHSPGNRAQGALYQPADDARDRRTSARRKRCAAAETLRSPGAGEVCLCPCLAAGRHPDVGQPLHAACPHGFFRRRAPPAAAHEHFGRDAGVAVQARCERCRTSNRGRQGENMKRRRNLAIALSVLTTTTFLALITSQAWAQSRTIKIINPFPP